MKNLLIFIIIFISLSVKAQLNLVPNGDFEIYSSLPTNYCQANLAIGWNNVNGDYSCAKASPDYFNLSSFSALGSIIPYSGNGQMGLVLYQDLGPFREYISIQSLTPMISGRQYTVSFYITNGKDTFYTKRSNNLGVRFSTISLSQVDHEPISVIPQFEINFIMDYWNYWQKFSFNYIADSTYKYITIGNFRDNSHTLVSSFGITGAYYFIDKIEIYLAKLKITGDSILCKGDTATLTATMDTVIWADALQPNLIISTDKTIKVNPTTTTTYLAYDAYDTASFTVYVVNQPTVNLGNDTTLCFGHSIILDAGLNAAVYQWQDNTANATFTVNQEGQYWLKLTDSNQCTALDTINIAYQYCLIPEIWIPNSFTPNGDGLNDFFKPETLAELENYTMLIFNRWGELIYESKDINKGWDGKYKGKLLEFGVYTYRIEATEKATMEKKVYCGKVTVIK